MSKKILFFISFVLVLSLAYMCYGADPRMLKLDFNNTEDNTEVETEPGEIGFDANHPYYDPNLANWTAFTLDDSGDIVNDVQIDLSGANPVYGDLGEIESRRRENPYSYPNDTNNQQLYMDFVLGVGDEDSGLKVELWGLGANREVNITVWAYDDSSVGSDPCGGLAPRVANWYANAYAVNDINDAHIFDTNFHGDDPYWPLWMPLGEIGGAGMNWGCPNDYTWSAVVTTDYLGRIILTAEMDPCSGNPPFAFLNAMIVEPNGAYTATEYAHRPRPRDTITGVPIDESLTWRQGGSVTTHDLYLGLDANTVADANTTSHPNLVAYAPGLATNDYDPFGATGFLDLDTTYYWRVDENAGGQTYKGEVWSFTTKPYFMIDNFNSYDDTSDLRDVWQDFYENFTSALVYRNLGSEDEGLVIDGNSMRYYFGNDNDPETYSEATVDIADLDDDPDWDGIGAKALVIYFKGVPANPNTEDMYLTLTDGATTGRVDYPDTENLRDPSIWHEWNIDLGVFDACGVNMDSVSSFTIGFGDASAGNHGEIYIEDIQLWVTRCAPSGRTEEFAKLDFGPPGQPAGDCVVDQVEIGILGNDWLLEDETLPTETPSDGNLVCYYNFNQDHNNGREFWDLQHPNDPCWTANIYSGYYDSNVGVEYAIGSSPFDDNCVFIDGTRGSRISCGLNGDGSEGQGHKLTNDDNDVTISAWIKWGGPRDPRGSQPQGIVAQRNGWGDASHIFEFDCDTPDTEDWWGGLQMRQYGGEGDIATPPGILNAFIGKWAHVAMTHQGDGTMTRIYLNGNEVASGTEFEFGGPGNEVGDPNSVGLTIGNMNDSGWPQCPGAFNGFIDEVKIYSQTLEPNEIAYLADLSPGDNELWVPIPSSAELYDSEDEGDRVIDFKDYAIIANAWLTEQMFPLE